MFSRSGHLSGQRLPSHTSMKLRIATLALLPAAAACGSLDDDRLVASAVARPAIHPNNLVVQPQEAGAESEVEWFHSGPYIGATVGFALSTAGDSDIDSDLADRGYVTSTDLDDGDVGWKVLGGYRFEQPFAVEMAAVDLGTIESDIEVSTSDIDTFLGDVSKVHPFSAKGASITGTWFPIDDEDWQLGLKGGLWWWDGEVEARAASGEKATDSDTGVDLVLGAVGLFDIGEEWAIRAEAEHYWIDDEGVTLFAIGAQWSPGPSTQRPLPMFSDEGLPPALLRRSR